MRLHHLVSPVGDRVPRFHHAQRTDYKQNRYRCGQETAKRYLEPRGCLHRVRFPMNVDAQKGPAGNRSKMRACPSRLCYLFPVGQQTGFADDFLASRPHGPRPRARSRPTLRRLLPVVPCVAPRSSRLRRLFRGVRQQSRLFRHGRKNISTTPFNSPASKGITEVCPSLA